MLRALKRNLL